MATVMLIDGNSLTYRAFFALPTDMATASGQVTNAVFGFTSMLINLMKDHEPDHIAVAFDRPEPTFRHEMTPTYKAQRESAPDILRQQMGLVREVLDAMAIPTLETIGFEAVATTSAGLAHAFGRLDGEISLTEVVRHVADLVDAVSVPVAVDFENGFDDDPAGVAANVTTLFTTGAAGVSIEDHTGRGDDPIYELGLAVERVEAVIEAARAEQAQMVVTARAENYLHGRPDLTDTIARLAAFAEAGADCVYAPGITDADDIRRVVDAVGVPVNVLALPGVPPIAELADLGVARVSVGSGFARAALGAMVRAGRELLTDGTYDFWRGALDGDDRDAAFS